MGPQNDNNQQQGSSDTPIGGSSVASDMTTSQGHPTTSSFASPQTQSQPLQPSKPQSSKSKFIWIGIIILLLAALGAVGYLYNAERTEHDKAQAALGIEQFKNQELQKELKASIRPATLAAFSPQCPKDNAQDLILARLNNDPVEGNIAYLALCRSDLKNATIQARATVVQTKEGEQDKFVYGASTSEPRCLTKSLVGSATSELASKSGLSICK